LYDLDKVYFYAEKGGYDTREIITY